MPVEILVAFCLSGILFMAVLVFAVQRLARFQRALQLRFAEIEAQEAPILSPAFTMQRFQIEPVGAFAPRARWETCILALTATHLILYERGWTVLERQRIALDGVRWFGRPKKYEDGNNDIWLHIEDEGRWSILKIRLPRAAMSDFVRALKTVLPAELVTAYRRRRPYIHAGPQPAQPAVQDIHGAWTLDEPVDLYLMPRYLIVMRAGVVLRRLALEAVQEIGALRRLDAPGEQGLVRFRAEEETFAFAHPRHEQFAALLAEAAKRTLEAPLERKQKNKLEEDYEYDYDEDIDGFTLEENYDA